LDIKNFFETKAYFFGFCEDNVIGIHNGSVAMIAHLLSNILDPPKIYDNYIGNGKKELINIIYTTRICIEYQPLCLND
jgi:hypothetical protein